MARRPLTRMLPKRWRTALAPRFADGLPIILLDTGAALRRLPDSLVRLTRGALDPSKQIVVAGSGRSGTTWLTEVLASAGRVTQIFEPMHPQWVRVARQLMPRETWGPFPSAQGPRVHPTDSSPEWEAFVNRLLTGRVRCHWTDRFQDGWGAERLLIKTVRANMMLGYVIDRFSPTVVFLMRHPCAVVHSRMSRRWHSNPRLLLQYEELVDCYLRPWVGDVERCANGVEAHAIWWAVENRVALDELASRTHVATSFERLNLLGEVEVRRIFNALQLRPPSGLEEKLLRRSQMSREGVEYSSAWQRLTAWEQAMSPRDVGLVLRWTERLRLDRYDESPLPREPWTQETRHSDDAPPGWAPHQE